MTEPHHDGDDELNELYQLLARSRGYTQELERRIAEREGTPTEEFHRRRRRGFYIVPGVTAAATGANALRRWASRNNSTIAAFGAGAAIAAVSALAITHPGHRTPPHATPAPNPPAGALPPPSHKPRPTAPPTSGPGGPPPAVPSPTPGPTHPAAPPHHPGGTPTSSPPHPPPPSNGQPPSQPDEPITTTTCRLYFPKLGICLLPVGGGLIERPRPDRPSEGR